MAARSDCGKTRRNAQSPQLRYPAAQAMTRVLLPVLLLFWAGLLFDINLSYPYLSGAVTMFVGFLISLVLISQISGATELELGAAPG